MSTATLSVLFASLSQSRDFKMWYRYLVLFLWHDGYLLLVRVGTPLPVHFGTHAYSEH